MTNIVYAAAVSLSSFLNTNGLDYAVHSDFAITNTRSIFADVRNAVIVKREMKCPHCGVVSTNDVDVTDLHNYYERRENRMLESDTRLMREAYHSGYRSGINDTKNAIFKEMDSIKRRVSQ